MGFAPWRKHRDPVAQINATQPISAAGPRQLEQDDVGSRAAEQRPWLVRRACTWQLRVAVDQECRRPRAILPASDLGEEVASFAEQRLVFLERGLLILSRPRELTVECGRARRRGLHGCRRWPRGGRLVSSPAPRGRGMWVPSRRERDDVTPALSAPVRRVEQLLWPPARALRVPSARSRPRRGVAPRVVPPARLRPRPRAGRRSAVAHGHRVERSFWIASVAGTTSPRIGSGEACFELGDFRVCQLVRFFTVVAKTTTSAPFGQIALQLHPPFTDATTHGVHDSNE